MGYFSKETFSEALGVCLEEGGALLGIKSASQNQHVENLLLKNKNIKSVWIDLMDESSEGLWLDHDSLEGLLISMGYMIDLTLLRYNLYLNKVKFI